MARSRDLRRIALSLPEQSERCSHGRAPAPRMGGACYVRTMPRPRRRSPRLGFAALALVLACGWATPPPAPAASAHAPAVHARSRHKPAKPPEVSLAPAPAGTGAPVTMRPVGLSLEYPLMARLLGTGPCPPPSLAAELVRLGSPPLALSGISQDLTVPAEAASGAPESWTAATAYTLPAGFWSQLHCLLTLSGDPLTVGLNARIGSPAWTARMIAGAQSAATAGLDFSLGNEPDLYYLPNYASLAKPLPNEEAADANLYLQVAGYLLQGAGGALPLIGPELARAAHWQREFPRVIAALHERTVGVHAYPLSSCVTPRAATIKGLLSTSAGEAPRRQAWVIADARAAGVPAIISEANSVSCGGRPGVSDSPAAAVWAVRFVLSALKTGFQEVRFHFSGGSYDPFAMRGSEVVARPLENALVALNQWLAPGSSLRTVSVRGLTASSVRTPAGASILILDNEGTRARTVVARGAAAVRVEKLTSLAPGLATSQPAPVHAAVKLQVAPNSIVAITPLP
jgi:hypothetical protein